MVTIYGLLMLVALVSRASALAPCACTSDFRPVCGSDGTTYANQCLLECEVNSGKQITKARDGSCEPAEPEQSVCRCTFNYAPVCGSDGQTYPNQCALECDQATTPELRMAHPGECKCTCTRESQFVCGSDGTTYSNRCLLECSQSANPGLQLAHVGPCEDIV